LSAMDIVVVVVGPREVVSDGGGSWSSLWVPERQLVMGRVVGVVVGPEMRLLVDVGSGTRHPCVWVRGGVW